MGPVIGRSEDLVRTRDGRRIGYLCFHATKTLTGIKEAQLIQEDFDKFRFRLVLAPEGFAIREQLEHSISQEVGRRLRSEPELVFDYVDRIPRGPRGKFKAVVVSASVGMREKSGE